MGDGMSAFAHVRRQVKFGDIATEGDAGNCT